MTELDKILTHLKFHLNLLNFDEDFIPIKKTKCKIDSNIISLEDISKSVSTCDKCSLSFHRLNTVPGEGPDKCTICFIGEAPGADEDSSGRPFVGEAGKLLTRIIEAMGLKREEVFITNVVKCRPPQNRTPKEEEIKICSDYLNKQLLLLKPKVIVALGAVSAQFLLNTKVSIGKIRGRSYEKNGSLIFPTFHPAHLLYNPEDKKAVWEDMKQVMKFLNLKRPK